ncbi:hypothetical protein A2W14_05955 [Candidatus Gottesmanbacteria bacterium RBG_16_37_8]|uniref:GHMP kinase N-terminal domain-containing protein n=1 Tax=Candidatus Gottesmanbacteria bacterium RBG_16_37_8 TaxID=1798371 RepID=A0A1F5YV49_9BACT|nr:MAG: hypothetical protein A2W14_05955 [Candidatus Gottesmanbacteria bacterium RBG_16_37_8]
MKKAKATCPSSLSFIFKAILPKENKIRQISISDLLTYYSRYGSVGVGCTIDKKVTVEVSRSQTNRLTFNGEKLNLPTVWRAVSFLAKDQLEINISSPLPLGCGFGISGAATLASLWAIRRLFNLKESSEKLALISHFAEIAEKTGLGTVATQITGGFLVKKKAGIPPRFRELPLLGEKIYAVKLRPMATAKVLEDKRKLSDINYYADAALTKINSIKNPTLKEIINISYEFYRKSKIFDSKKGEQLIKVITKQGGSATMAIIGEVIFCNVEPILSDSYKIYELTISKDTVS